MRITVTIETESPEDAALLETAARGLSWQAEVYPEVVTEDGRLAEGPAQPNPVPADQFLAQHYSARVAAELAAAIAQRQSIEAQIEADRAARAAERGEETP